MVSKPKTFQPITKASKIDWSSARQSYFITKPQCRKGILFVLATQHHQKAGCASAPNHQFTISISRHNHLQQLGPYPNLDQQRYPSHSCNSQRSFSPSQIDIPCYYEQPVIYLGLMTAVCSKLMPSADGDLGKRK